MDADTRSDLNILIESIKDDIAMLDINIGHLTRELGDLDDDYKELVSLLRKELNDTE